MIETLPEQAPLADLHLPADVQSQFADFRSTLQSRSQIVWAEHCSECAYPTCYAHCAFYTPRSDFHCRRFVAGIETVKADPHLSRIRFRKWGKLEGQGPAAFRSMSKVDAVDGLDAIVAKVIASTPAPLVLKRRAALRWNRRKAQVAPGDASPQAFVTEYWSSDGRDHPFTLTFIPLARTQSAQEDRLFQVRFDVGPTYGRLAVPVEDISAHVDLNRPFLCQIEPVGDAEGVEVVFGVCDFVEGTFADATTSIAPSDVLSPASKAAKVVVWDLDETVWTGVLGEDGADGVYLRPEAAAAIRLLDERGILQTISSKNNEIEAMRALDRFHLSEYFLHPQIHWGRKSGSIAAQARTFDLGLDSFVFIDDQPFERGEVQSVLPDVRVLSHTQVGEIPTHPWFDVPSTAESRVRRPLYQQEARRVDAYQAAGEDYRVFLRDSGIELYIDPLTPADLERVYELSQRTNQLNFTGRKYTREAVRDLLMPLGGFRSLVLRCRDRFGDYGLIGFVVMDLKQGLVSDLFLSCRVQRKRVEHALFSWLESQAETLDLLNVVYHPTGRNGAARDMLAALGLTQRDESSTIWERVSSGLIEDADIVKVIARTFEPTA